MTKLFEQKMDFPYLTGLIGFVLGIMLMLLISTTTYANEPKVIIQRVTDVQYVEKPVVVNKPIYLTNNDKQQIQCLAENAYFEAGNQSMKGKQAVTHVVMNRVKDGRFPKTPCGVVYQKTGGTCQFSWVCEGKKRVRDWTQFRESRKAAEQVYLKNVRDVTHGAKFYHADYVSPGWRLQRITKIGDHIFYR